MSRRSLVVGIEGGRARTTALLADDVGNLLARRQGNTTITSPLALDAVGRTLFSLIGKCCDDARCQPEDLAAVVFGFASPVRATEFPRIRDAVNGFAARGGHKPLPISIESDARIILEGAFDRGPGVVIIAGSGSAVIGKTPRGEIKSVGGWGRILGDEGSGYAIGREALIAVARESDHLGSAGTLHQVFASKFQLDSRDEIIAAVYQDNFDIASLAPVVLDTAAHNDVIAQRIVDRAATQLADQARIVVLPMGIHRKVGLVMAGSLLEQETVYANTLHMKLIRLLPQVEIRTALHEPAHGAVLLALDKLKKV